ncbi:hypothetical protein BD413DRAFT_469634 [Trametes elegans]|nr:hypothetical protein BD413DRAFT_469634 [Trametes elegans]
MYSHPPRRGLHRKRLSALRLSSDSTVTTLPVYSSSPRPRLADLPDIPAEQPPAYSDSAEEADEDTDPSDTDLLAPSPPPSLPVSPRPGRRSRNGTRSHHHHHHHRRQQSSATSSADDPYLDALLARSVHALEMSNALLQSSMSTQSSLSTVLTDDSLADRSLERHAHRLTSRIHSNRDLHESWMDDLDEITRGVEGLVRGEDEAAEENGITVRLTRPQDVPVSQSLPTGGLSERMQQRRRGRRASQDYFHHRPPSSSSASGSQLQLSAHDRSAFVAPAPRALTMYIDSAEAADAIALPSTLGVRAASRPPPTPLPCQTTTSSVTSEPEPPPPLLVGSTPEQTRRAMDMLSSFVTSRTSSSVSSSPSSSSLLRRRGSSSSSHTAKKHRGSKSPPPSLHLDTPSTVRSRSLTPNRGSPIVRQPRPLTPPIEELSTSSASSDSRTLHVDRTVESLRQILEKQRAAAQASAVPPAPLPRPSLLSPPTVAPTSGTSNATASVSRLFTKSRHTTSTRPPSPPRQSSMKGRSAPPTPTGPAPPLLPAPPRTPSRLSVPDVFGVSGMFLGGRRSGASSGASTPKRISFAEPPEPYSSSRGPGGAAASSSSSNLRARRRGRSGSKACGKGKGNGRGKGRKSEDEGDEEEGGVGWWAGWLLGGAAGEGRARSEERYGAPRGVGGLQPWSMRPGFGNGLEEWGA